MTFRANKRRKVSTVAEHLLLDNGSLLRVDPPEVAPAVLARVGIGSELVNIAGTAIRTQDGFIGHRSYLSQCFQYPTNFLRLLSYSFRED